MFEKQPKKISNNKTLIFAGIIITLLVIVIAAIIFLMAKNGSHKETAQPKNNEQSTFIYVSRIGDNLKCLPIVRRKGGSIGRR